VRRDLATTLVPPFAGWSAFQGTDNFATLCDYTGALRDDARRFELVTLPFQDMLGMSYALDLLDELGIERIEAHLTELEVPLLEWAQRRGVRIVSPRGARSSGMVCLAAQDLPPDVGDALREAGVVASVREGALRFSPHCYNTLEEMERVADALDMLISS
jgi:selenocysteine lyase/cysteine desulfurase